MPMLTQRCFSDAPLYALPECDRCLGARVGQHGREFFAAEPPYDVARARLQAQQFSEVAECAIAECVPPTVVERLEMIEVEHQHGSAATIPAPDPGKFEFTLNHEVTAVGQLGQVIDCGEFVQFRLDAFALG
jgi:hypothetical protein